MAKPIAETPFLTGSDAARFEQEIGNAKSVSKEEYEKTYENYKIIEKMVETDL